MAAMAELRGLIEGVAERVSEPRAQAEALAQSLAAQARKLDQLATLQRETVRRLDEVGRRRAQPLLARLLDHARRGTATWRARLAAALPGPAPSPAAAPMPPMHWILSGTAREQARAIMVLVCGLSPDDLTAVLSRIGEGLLPAGIVPVFVTDGSELAPFRARRALFEQLPLRPPAGRGPARDHELYAARRFCLLGDRWEPLRVVAFGPAAARQLDLWRQSPHVTPAVRELLATAEPG